MGYLSQHKRKPEASPIIWLSTEESPRAWTELPWFKGVYLGASERAVLMGYSLQQFWCLEEGMTPERVVHILKSRGIRGAILSHPSAHSFLKDLPLDFCAVAQVQCDPWNQTYHVACPDFSYNMRQALKNLSNSGYKRPALLLITNIDETTNEAYSAGYLRYQMQLSKKNRLPYLIYKYNDPDVPQKVGNYIAKHTPDVVICNDQKMFDHIQTSGYRVPEDLGLAHLNLAVDVQGWSGIDQNQKEIGAAAIDLVIGQLRRNETGFPESPRALLCKGLWKSGQTTRLKE